MIPELPTPRDTANKVILVKSLLDLVLTDPKYQEFKEELKSIEDFKNGKAFIDDAIKSLESIASKSAPL